MVNLHKLTIHDLPNPCRSALFVSMDSARKLGWKGGKGKENRLWKVKSGSIDHGHFDFKLAKLLMIREFSSSFLSLSLYIFMGHTFNTVQKISFDILGWRVGFCLEFFLFWTLTFMGSLKSNFKNFRSSVKSFMIFIIPFTVFKIFVSKFSVLNHS